MPPAGSGGTPNPDPCRAHYHRPGAERSRLGYGPAGDRVAAGDRSPRPRRAPGRPPRRADFRRSPVPACGREVHSCAERRRRTPPSSLRAASPAGGTPSNCPSTARRAGRACCYVRANEKTCARCGQTGHIAARREEGGICRSCYAIDPQVLEECGACGRARRPAVRRPDGTALCEGCWRPPARTCSCCGTERPASLGPDGAYCHTCYRRLRQPRRPCRAVRARPARRGQGNRGQSRPLLQLHRPAATGPLLGLREDQARLQPRRPGLRLPILLATPRRTVL